MNTPVMTVYVAQGCGACHAYVPVLQQVGRPYSRRVRLNLVEISSPAGQQAASAAKIKATPTTIVRSASGKHYRRVGALPPDQIQALLEAAIR